MNLSLQSKESVLFKQKQNKPKEVQIRGGYEPDFYEPSRAELLQTLVEPDRAEPNRAEPDFLST